MLYKWMLLFFYEQIWTLCGLLIFKVQTRQKIA